MWGAAGHNRNLNYGDSRNLIGVNDIIHPFQIGIFGTEFQCNAGQCVPVLD